MKIKIMLNRLICRIIGHNEIVTGFCVICGSPQLYCKRCHRKENSCNFECYFDKTEYEILSNLDNIKDDPIFKLLE